MKKLKNIVLVLIAGNLCVSCETMNSLDTSTVLSTVAGAGIGAVIGHQSGRAREGALAGAATGLFGSKLLSWKDPASSAPSSRQPRQRPSSSYKPAYKPAYKPSRPASSGSRTPSTQFVKAKPTPAPSSAPAVESGSVAVTENGVIEY